MISLYRSSSSKQPQEQIVCSPFQVGKVKRRVSSAEGFSINLVLNDTFRHSQFLANQVISIRDAESLSGERRGPQDSWNLFHFCLTMTTLILFFSESRHVIFGDINLFQANTGPNPQSCNTLSPATKPPATTFTFAGPVAEARMKAIYHIYRLLAILH